MFFQPDSPILLNTDAGKVWTSTLLATFINKVILDFKGLNQWDFHHKFGHSSACGPVLRNCRACNDAKTLENSIISLLDQIVE